MRGALISMRGALTQYAAAFADQFKNQIAFLVVALSM